MEQTQNFLKSKKNNLVSSASKYVEDAKEKSSDALDIISKYKDKAKEYIRNICR